MGALQKALVIMAVTGLVTTAVLPNRGTAAVLKAGGSAASQFALATQGQKS